jgi:hypothetical protein
MLPREELRFAIFQWIWQSIPETSRWRPVWQRYLGMLGTRLIELGGDPAPIKPSPTGYGGLPGRLPGGVVPGGGLHGQHDNRRLAIEGKIAGIVYDHFGDFEGFILDTDHGEHRRFESHEDAIKGLIEAAWRRRIRTVIVPEQDDPARVQSVELR